LTGLQMIPFRIAFALNLRPRCAGLVWETEELVISGKEVITCHQGSCRGNEEQAFKYLPLPTAKPSVILKVGAAYSLIPVAGLRALNQGKMAVTNKNPEAARATTQIGRSTKILNSPWDMINDWRRAFSRRGHKIKANISGAASYRNFFIR